MKLLIVAASTVALLCAAPFAIAIANANAHNAIEVRSLLLPGQAIMSRRNFFCS
jgi:hypothetical protein